MTVLHRAVSDRSPHPPRPAYRTGPRAPAGLWPATLVATLAGLAASAQALPMASQGSWMVMADLHSAGERDLAANYAVTGHDAIGAMTARWHEPVLHAGLHRRPAEREAPGLTYTRLVKRWNLAHAQANLWFVGSTGRARGDGGFRAQGFWSPAVMADYETTRVYLGGGWEPKRGTSLRHDVGWLRAGFSFYEVDYEQVQPWLIVEAKRTRSSGATSDLVTPMLRFIHRGLFVELGHNREGTQFNLMWSY